MKDDIIRFNRIRDIRVDKDIKQKDVAKKLNIAQNTLSQYENGIRNIPNEVLISLAKLYDTSIDYMLGLTDYDELVNNMYQRIKDLREDNDITQEKVAKILCVKQATYSRYELGKLDIPTISLIKLAKFYKTSIDYLLGVTDERKPYP